MSIAIAFVIIFFCLQFYILLTTQYEKSLVAAFQKAAEWQGVTKTIVTINHELNSPLTALMAGSGLLFLLDDSSSFLSSFLGGGHRSG
jgi:hypothetical protein